MEVVQFRKTSGDSWTSMDAIQVVPDWEVDGLQYTDLNDVNRDQIDAVRKVFHVELARLTTTQQDLLIDLQAEEDARFNYSSTEYNIRVKSLNVRHVGAKITVIHRDPE